jgi:hypothetical protein
MDLMEVPILTFLGMASCPGEPANGTLQPRRLVIALAAVDRRRISAGSVPELSLVVGLVEMTARSGDQVEKPHGIAGRGLTSRFSGGA